MTSKSDYLERETKFSATMEFDPPDLRQIVGGTERLPDEDLRTRYFDTPDFRLWSRGITLRHCTGEGPGRGTWTLKLPSSDAGATLERTELSWPGEADVVPDEAMSSLKGVVRRSVVGAIADLRTTRRRLVLKDAGGSVWGELDDDVVTVAGGPLDGVRFRQLEVELRPGQPPAAGAVVAALKAAGAKPDGQPKLARALGLAERSKRPKPPRHARKKARIDEIVRRSIAEGLDRILDRDYRMRIDAELNPSDVHQVRVATRRLRSNLKTFGCLLDPIWLGHARTELGWLGEALGRVRDCDVLASELDRNGAHSADRPNGQAELQASLAAERRAASAELLTAMSAKRYLNLMDRLHAAIVQPPFLVTTKAGRGRTTVDAPARDVLPGLVREEWRALHRKLRKLERRPSDRQLHRTRILAKQLRYAAEAAAPLMGKPARRTAAAAEALQTVLGEHHDAVGAEKWLRLRAHDGPPRQARRAEELAALQRRRQKELRRQWRAPATRVSQKRVRRWIR